MLQGRDISVIFGSFETGGVELTMGQTRIFANTQATMVAPHPIRPSEGFLKFHVDLSVLKDTLGINPQKQSMEIEKYIERVIKGSKALDTESLCIKSGKSVWSIDVTISLINNDGNLIDSVYLCTLLSLLHFRRPQVKVGNTIDLDLTKRYVPLSIHHIPLSLTFAIFENEKTQIVFDPSQEEENIQQGRITLSVNIYNDICHIHKPGGCPIDLQMVNQLIQSALIMAKPYTGQIRAFLDNKTHFETLKTSIKMYEFKLNPVQQPAIQIEQLEQLY